jgi:hypothetical protein
MVDRRGQVFKEVVQGVRVVGVEGRGVLGTDLCRGVVQAVRTASGENDIGSLGAGSSGGLQADACATTDQDDSLSKQLRFVLRGLRIGSVAQDTQAATNQSSTRGCRWKSPDNPAKCQRRQRTPDLLSAKRICEQIL